MELKHYGTPRHSGRYPYGSGDDPEQRDPSLLGQIEDLKKQGLKDTEIARGLGMTTTEFRQQRSLAKAEKRAADASQALKLKDKGYSNVEIGKRMGINESSVRSLLDPAIQERSNITQVTSNMLKDAVAEKGFIDVGAGVERHIGVSRTKLKTAIAALKDEGYTVHYVPVEQLGTGKKTSIMVLAPPGTEYKEVYNNKDQIKMITDHTQDGGRSYLGLEPIKNVDSKRIFIKYAEDGGTDKDGVIELRRNVEDLNLGNSKYAQVRIGVDGSHYLKGMAMYSDNVPKGYEIVFNTNKKNDTPPEKVFKEMKEDADNPFGATIKRGGQRGALNIVNEEGDWDGWSKNISSQFLSKQNPSLAKKQLGLALDIKKEEYDEIMSLTNPAVKKRLLDAFADDCDSAAVHLKAAALPRQGSHVILPFPSMKETEIYAPKYRDGEQVVLIRYPHGGIFEIPQLTVNNKHPEANKSIKQAKDAVGINPKVAERLSGADFDGDTVLVIPNPPSVGVKTSAPLKGLINFDPKTSYPPYDGMKTIDGGVYNAKTKSVDYGNKSPKTRPKQMKMGDVSNLITDMTIKGANADEIAKAVRHSMVVIDSEKHSLNYKQSYIDNGIASLKTKYQGGANRGASTLVSRAASTARPGVRKETIDKETGKKIYEYTNESYTNKNGKEVRKTTTSTKMYEAEDAFELSSGTTMETIYATHANKLKSLANESRKASINTAYVPYSPSAKKTYDKEVTDLKHKLNIALMNKPLERQAQLLANTVVATKVKASPGMDKDDVKRLKGQALAEARVRAGAKKHQIDLTDREWEAIQAGAISTNTLTQILNNTDLDRVKMLATPRRENTLSPVTMSRAKSMLASGYTQADIADALGISTTTLSKNL